MGGGDVNDADDGVAGSEDRCSGVDAFHPGTVVADGLGFLTRKRLPDLGKRGVDGTCRRAACGIEQGDRGVLPPLHLLDHAVEASEVDAAGAGLLTQHQRDDLSLRRDDILVVVDVLPFQGTDDVGGEDDEHQEHEQQIRPGDLPADGAQHQFLKAARGSVGALNL